MHRYLKTLAGISAVLAFALPVSSGVIAQENVVGEREYAQSCSVCHGSAGFGDGEFAQFMTVPPADLTVLTKNNDGVFPFLKVFQIIDGRTIIRSHGSVMPIWGNTYQAEIGDAAGPYGAELMIRARVVALVDYVETLQR